MTKYVVPIADPPPGQDWVATVPGIYVYDVIGITAELVTGSGLPPMHDASGNGYDGTYQAAVPADAAPEFNLPGAVTGNAAVGLAPSIPSGLNEMLVDRPMAIDVSRDFTIEIWTAQNAGNLSFPFYEHDLAGTNLESLAVSATGEIALTRNGSELYQTVAGAYPLDGAYHLIQCCFDFAGPYRCCVDGAPVTIASTVPPGSRAVLANSIDQISFGRNLFAPFQLVDEVALYPTALTNGQCAVRYASRGTFVLYASGVAGDGAQAYYHLDETFDAAGGRQPTLEVTNGTSTVLAIPTGFPAVSTPGPYNYAWQPGLNADTQSSDGTLTTVAIPTLVIPPGYTVGTRTLDLSSTDQWTNIALWWDDTYQNLTQGAYDYGFPPGRFYVYQRAGVQP